VSESSNRPIINLFAVELSFKNLRRQIKRSTAKGGPNINRAVNRPSEITNFSHTLHNLMVT